MLLHRNVIGLSVAITFATVLLANYNDWLFTGSDITPQAVTTDFSDLELPLKLGIFSTEDDATIADFEFKHAMTAQEHAQGLMHITKMPEQAGMLFTWKLAKGRTFWMKNTPLPLDLLFIRDGIVVSIMHGEPYSLAPIGPINADTIVELHHGASRKYGVGIGSQLSILELSK